MLHIPNVNRFERLLLGDDFTPNHCFFWHNKPQSHLTFETEALTVAILRMTHPERFDYSHFLLVGNGSYQNRGCEAIVRGTMAILRREFGAEIKAAAGVYSDQETIWGQNKSETDSEVFFFALNVPSPRWSRIWWEMQLDKRLGTSFAARYSTLLPHLKKASVALVVGGDNYSLDYGTPAMFLHRDQFLQSKGVPLVLWGASVGPFDSEPKFAEQMFTHLRTLNGIFVRETASRDYLRKNGVKQNVHLVADPAFAMEPVEPRRAKLPFAIPSGAVGLNLSPLIARNFLRQSWQEWKATGYDLTDWMASCVEVVKVLSNLAKRPIVLVPHVGWDSPHNDDFSFLENVQRLASDAVQQPLLCLPPGLSAAETKWVIAQCDFFVGARTHSTIAAISSGIPTLSIGYSLKARGINQDVFGNLDFYIGVDGLAIGTFRERFQNLLEQESRIRKLLGCRIPQVTAAAFQAGPLLRRILN